MTINNSTTYPELKSKVETYFEVLIADAKSGNLASHNSLMDFAREHNFRVDKSNVIAVMESNLTEVISLKSVFLFAGTQETEISI